MNHRHFSSGDNLPYLQANTPLDDYVIERPLSCGGFSLVYLARRTADQQQVAIKEYFPRKLATRSDELIITPNDAEAARAFTRGRQHFLEEAKVLAKLKHPNILDVQSFFQCNGTAYLVMSFCYGRNLADYLTEKQGRLSGVFLLNLFRSLLDGVYAIHKAGLLHLDIKPQNILIRPGGSPLLLDFGAVQPYPNTRTWSPGKVLTKGFSPIEQYSSRHGNIGPWSDIYALGATMRSCLDSKAPPASTQRLESDSLPPAATAYHPPYPLPLLQAIDWAMAVVLDQRPQTIEELRYLLDTP
ncbi:MAG: serine/threonine protein kinase [Methylococcaceae bacterium]|nr:MAG: serine/threonine protein kinase [Methylococcaceae bacterium]